MTPEHRSMTDDFSFRFMDAPRVAPVPRAPTPPALSHLLGSGRRLGVTIESIDDQLAEYFGVKEGALVKSVLDGSAAQKAGLKAGDVITSVDGRNVTSAGELIGALPTGSGSHDISLAVTREKKELTLKATL